MSTVGQENERACVASEERRREALTTASDAELKVTSLCNRGKVCGEGEG